MNEPSPTETPLRSLQNELQQTHRRVDRWTAARSGARCTRFEPLEATGTAIFLKELGPDESGTCGRIVEMFTALDAQIRTRAPEDRAYRVPRVVAFGSNPAYLAYEWAAGSLLSVTLRELTMQPGAESLQQAVEMSGRAGAALCQLHGDLATVLHGREIPLVRPRWAAPIARLRLLPGRPCPSVVDVGPWNVVVDGNRPPTFIDLDVERSREPEFDVGWFAFFNVDKAGDIPLRDSLNVVTSFVDGYIAQTGVEISQPLVYAAAGFSGASRGAARMRALRPSGSGRRWILRRVGVALVLVPYGVLSAIRTRIGRSRQ